MAADGVPGAQSAACAAGACRGVSAWRRSGAGGAAEASPGGCVGKGNGQREGEASAGPAEVAGPWSLSPAALRL